MANITVNAAYASVVEDDDEGLLFIGFAQGEAEDETYALFRQPLAGGPVWFEVTDESFGAEEALQSVTLGPSGIEIAIRPEKSAQLGWATSVSIAIAPTAEGRDEAYAALAAMLGPICKTAAPGS